MARLLRGLLLRPAGAAGLLLVAAVTVAAVGAPWLAPGDPYQLALESRLEPPSAAHPLGTDHLGRDILSRLLYGARVSLAVGVVSQLISAAIGFALGAVAGYCGRWVDVLIMRLADVLLAVPGLLLVVPLLFVLGPGLTNLFLALGLVGWPGLARLVRAEVLRLRGLEFVEAARAAGAGGRRILVRHLSPNAVTPLLVTVSLGIPSAIMAEAGLSFLGLGVEPPVPSWGQMVAAGRPFLRVAPWISLFPGLAVVLAVLAFNLLADALQETLGR